MAARGREQRHVVARALVAVGVAEIVDAGLAQLAEAAVAQIVVGADDFRARDPQRPLLGMVDDQQRTHRGALFGSTITRFAS